MQAAQPTPADARNELITLLEPSHPLPEFQDWAIAADFALIIARHILETRPSVVMELGSGLSTVIIGYALRKAGRGRLISVEHLQEYYDKTVARIEKHGLEAHIELLLCPLAPCKTPDGEQPWYSIPAQPQPVDLLIIDGPPAMLCPYARYPTLQQLWRYLAKDAVIMLDDSRREHEVIISERWRKNYPELTYEFVPTEKGTDVFRRVA